MNPWVSLDVEKRRRLVEKGVLPTTFTGVSSVDEGPMNERKSIPTFPHLLTPINQPFRKYQGFFGHFTYGRDKITYELELMSSLPNQDINQAIFGKVYLSENSREYFVKGMPRKESIPGRIDLKQLEQKLRADYFRRTILEFTSEKGYTNGDSVYWGPYVHADSQAINLRFQHTFCLNEVPSDEQGSILSLPIYHNAKSVFPNDTTTCGYCFFKIDETIYYIKKTKENYTLHQGRFGNASKDPHLYQLLLDALSLNNENISPFYTTQEMIQGGGIFAKAFNKTLIHATYAAAGYSLLKKMEDNLYQLFCAHPYYLGSALINGKPASFLYHLLGMFHAIASLVLDPLVELTALITRTMFASKPDEASDLFVESNAPPPLGLR